MLPIPKSRRVRQTKWLGLLLLIVVIDTSIAVAAIHHRAGHTAKQQIEALEEQWKTAQMTSDLAAMDSLMSEDFIGISIAGEANTKTQQLDHFRHRKLVFTKIDLSDRKIKLLGSVAIVTSLAEVEGTTEDEPVQGVYRYTRIYQLLPSGVWKTTNYEVTRVRGTRRR